MFFSLNRKIIYTIAVFFIFTATMFVYTFYKTYGSKIEEEQKTNFLRNQQFIELLYDNVSLRNGIVSVVKQNPNLKLNDDLTRFMDENGSKVNEETLSRERKHSAELVQNYNQKYQALQQAIRIVIGSAILIVLAMILLWLLIKKWVIGPINKLYNVRELVSSGTLSSRIITTGGKAYYDEFDKLILTFNQMLDNLEANIAEISNKEIFLQLLIDNIPDGIKVTDENGKIRIANKEYYRQIETAHKKTKKSNKDLYDYYSQYLAVNSAPLVVDKEKYTVESIRDLSGDIKFSHQQKLSSLGFLGTSVAHEMRNHLGSIRMIIEGLLSKFYSEPPYNEQAKEYLTLVNKQIVECSNIPDRLLKLAQFSTNKDEKIDCIESVKEVVGLIDYEAKRNGIEVNINAPETPIYITGAEADFKMMIINLSQNAIKAMKENGILNINVHTKGKKAIIEVCDNGKGIPQVNLSKIFEPFYSEGEKSGEKSGTGLGLSIVRSIIDKFDGDISVTSKLNQGTCFSLKFPLHK